MLRDWRRHRRLSQLDLAIEAEVSARHLSFVETGRSRPSRELLLHLAEHLDVLTALADELRGYPGVTERSAPPDAWS
jgi:transcriptional regulator with XRE-family HTH domain